jgi:hypothetical protein
MLFEKGMEQILKAPSFTKLMVAMSWSSLFESAGTKKLNCLNLLQPFFAPAVNVLLEFMKAKECSDSNLTPLFAECICCFF